MVALAGPAPLPRQAALRTLRAPASGQCLDQALLLWFPAPHSFTGEDVVEFHLHGGRAVVAGVLAALARIEGLRLAEPGEFTRRAFEHGKLDLTEVEALADLIDAETDVQRVQALREMTGGIGVIAEGWRGEVIRAQALAEAAIDFSDEADVSVRAMEQAREAAVGLRRQIAAVLDDGRRGEIIREGFRVVIAGPPNAGKSSLLNALSRRDVAIVSDEPGTTRDVIEVSLDLAGIPVLISDTAGLRAGAGKVEQEGIRRTIARVRAADLVLMLDDGDARSGRSGRSGRSDFSPELLMNLDLGSAPRLHVVSKIDLPGMPVPSSSCIGISSVSGAGLDVLIAAISARARAVAGVAGEGAVITRARQREALASALAALDAFLSGDLAIAELRAEDLRRAGHALARLTGRVDVEDVLGEIFGRFCIGK